MVTAETPKAFLAFTVIVFRVWSETVKRMQLVEVVAAHAIVPFTFTS